MTNVKTQEHDISVVPLQQMDSAANEFAIEKSTNAVGDLAVFHCLYDKSRLIRRREVVELHYRVVVELMPFARTIRTLYFLFKIWQL